MNARRQIQSLNRYDWGNKTPQQVAKYVGNKLEMLGYKVPNYMKKGKITQKQLDFHLDRVYNKLEKIVAKEEFLKLPKSEQNRIKNEQRLEKTIINYNVKVAKIRDIIQGSDEYSDKMKDFLIGEYSISNSRDKSFINEKFDLNFIDINKLNYTSITKEIKRIRNLNKNLSVEGVLNTLEDSTDEDNFLNLIKAMKLLEDNYLGGSGSRGYGKIKFKNLVISKRDADYYINLENEENSNSYEDINDFLSKIKE